MIVAREPHWIIHWYSYDLNRFECSQCHKRTILDFKYCPHCGALMYEHRIRVDSNDSIKTSVEIEETK